MKNNTVPESVVMAINALLTPYNQKYDPKSEQQTEPKSEKELISISEIEANYSIGRFTIYRKIKNGTLDAIKLNKAKSGKVLIRADSFFAWLNSCKQTPSN